MSADQSPAPRFEVYLTDTDLDDTLRADVTAGLTATPKSLPPKWFYDKVGSELFDQITRLAEYYPTEAERRALLHHADEIVAAAGCDTLVELGSGSSDKTRVLLDALRNAGVLRRYVPFDVSESALRDAAAALRVRYPDLSIHGVVGDFDRHLGHLPGDGRRMVAFLGGTIGNYAPVQRRQLLASIADGLEPGETLLLGTDLVKDSRRLVAAYDDASGVTAAFNRNMLDVVNQRLRADFRPEQFEHVAIWDAQAEWIEMRLRSTNDQVVTIADLGLEVAFAAGEELRTEISAKFRREGVSREVDAVGLELIGWWTDPAGDFALSLARRR